MARPPKSAVQMLKPHFLNRLLGIVVVLISAVVIAEPFNSCIPAQESETAKTTLTEQGIASFKSGDNKHAAQALRKATKQNGDDATAWHYLGLALVRQGERKEAGKAIRTAANLRVTHISSVLIDYGSSRREQITSLCQEAKQSVEEYLQIIPFGFQDDERLEWRRVLTSLQSLEQQLADGSRQIIPRDALTTHVRILEKPVPSYTPGARSAGLEGTVLLVVVFSDKGTVETLLPVRTLGHGLVFQAIEAARRIRFVPATKDGRPVSTVVRLEYNFSLT